MSNEAVITVSNDPLRSVADALDAAVQGAKGGVDDLRVTASGSLPALSSFLSGAHLQDLLRHLLRNGLSHGPGRPSDPERERRRPRAHRRGACRDRHGQ